MEYTIERAKPGDEGILAYIHTESWKAGFKGILSEEVLEKSTRLDGVTAMYRRVLEQGYGNMYLLKAEGKPHCIACWAPARSEDMAGYAELICIHSLPGQWRNGFGGKMMDVVLHDMAEAGYTKAMLWVFEQNMRARQFYEAKGFVTYGKVKPDSMPVELCYEKWL